MIHHVKHFKAGIEFPRDELPPELSQPLTLAEKIALEEKFISEFPNYSQLCDEARVRIRQYQRLQAEQARPLHERTDAAYMAGELGTHTIVSGGEVLELDGHLESQYDEQNGDVDLPF